MSSLFFIRIIRIGTMLFVLQLLTLYSHMMFPQRVV